jgi:hypothetical protein
MSTITRETVLIDRRQPVLRWSAVFAGAACSVGFWLLLQVLGVGIGLTAHDAADRVSTMHAARFGTTAWALIAQVIAAFFGGMVAGKLAQTYNRTHAGMHGLVSWALTSVVGLWATIWVITKLTVGADFAGDMADTAAAPSISAAGKALIVLGCSMLISLITSVLGAMAALGRPRRPGDGNVRSVRTTEHGYPAPHEPAVSTAPYPTPVTGPGTPVIPPSDVPR